MQSSQYNLFSLPSELIETLKPRNLVNKEPPRASTPELVVQGASSGPRGCGVCQGITFLDVKDQRAHFRSDWHRYNVKTRLNGGKTISEAEFAHLVDKLEESLSGSASSSEDEGSDDAVETLVNRTKRLEARSTPPEPAAKQHITPISWFHSPPCTQFGIYRAIFPLRFEQDLYLGQLRKMQQFVDGGRMWAMFMVAGGHFAGAVVRVSKAEEEDHQQEEPNRKQKMKKPKPDVEIILHKTFHRYTTRRKQGGSQSANDNAKGVAKSAGALLRRYGEQALRDDIRALLDEWSEYIAQSERIWIRASTSNRRIFYDYDEAVFQKSDERLRGFPFPTRRPTQSEIQRCLNELIHPKISHFTEEELQAQDDAYLASLPKPRPVPISVASIEPEKPKPVKLSKEEEVLRDKWHRLVDMVNKGRLETLKAFLEKESPTLGGVDAIIPEWTGDRRATILQIATQCGHEEMVRWLLEDANADPTIPISKASEEAGEEGTHSTRTAYDVAPTKAIRDAFRRAAALRPDQWDWFGAAHVPSALTHEKEEEQEQRKKVRRKGLKDKVRERMAKADEKEGEKTPELEDVPPPTNVLTTSNSTSHRLGGQGGTEGIAGLTPEMRLKVERERRARAAEARLKNLGGG